MKYEVTLNLTSTFIFTMEAEDEDAAYEEAAEYFDKMSISEQQEHLWDCEYDVENVEEAE